MGDVPEHDCPYRHEAAALREQLDDALATLAALSAAMEALERRILGPKSEKMPPVDRELRQDQSDEDAEARRLAALERRRERAAQKAKLRTERIDHPVPDADKRCPRCGGDQFRPLGPGKTSVVYEYVPGYFVRQEHVRQTVACRCGEHVITAEPALKPVEKGQYGPGLLAHLVVAKCADAIPLHRLAKQYQRLGIPMSRSTLTDLFHAAAGLLAPLAGRLLAIVAAQPVVQCDETSLKMQRPNRRGFVWTFLAEAPDGDALLIAYRFSGDRSGETPLQVLGGSQGTLVVDAYTGYNRVTDVDGRQRAGCLAHARRRFFEALTTAPEAARQALDLILDVYRVEHEVKLQRWVRTTQHAELRATRSRQAMGRLHAWLTDNQDLHPPKSPVGTAISYALNQWQPLCRFLDDVRIPPDNNASERALRGIALGRKNYLFVGDEDNGANLAGLCSLVATCEANDVDPLSYLADVLLRVHTHPQSRIDELLPHLWKPPSTAPPA